MTSRHRLTLVGPEDEGDASLTSVPENLLPLELGLSVWMQRNTIDPTDYRSAMLAIRASLLTVGGMDLRTEPIPLHGHSPEVEVANFAAYLAYLFIRVSAVVHHETSAIVDRVSELLAS